MHGCETKTRRLSCRPGAGSRPGRSDGRTRAFTLLEVLLVIGVISLLTTILLPSLSRATECGRRVICLNNLRALVIAAETYASNYNGRYPIAYYSAYQPPVSVSCAWDFNATKNWTSGQTDVEPGILWQGSGLGKIQQCPSFQGAANWGQDPYTGYNYNTSYIGHGAGEAIPQPASVEDVREPQTCALFGDGQYVSGANKFMRAPWKNPGDAQFSGRYAGTQGYRHLGATNVAFCDSHAVSWTECCKETYPSDARKIAPGTGFLSPDNSLYDLRGDE